MQVISLLVVSLSPAFLYAAKQMLHQDARIAEVWEAQTGHTAVEQVKEWRPHVVLLDERLPDMSLSEIVPKLRAQSCASRIVLMTLDDARPYRNAAAKLGLDGVIDKTQFAEEVEAFLAVMPFGSQQHIGNRRVRTPEAREQSPDWRQTMKDDVKTKAQLLTELVVRRQQVTVLEAQVSSHKQREETLCKNAERWRAAHELSLDGFAILWSVRDKQGKIVDFVWDYVNPAAAQFLCHPVADLTGSRLLQVLGGTQTGRAFFNDYVAIVETGVPQEREFSYSADGRTGWFRSSTVNLGDGVASSFTNITVRKQEQERLIQLAAIVESSDDAIIGKTLDGIIVSWNAGAERIYGYAADEVVGRPVSLLIPSHRSNELPQILERIRHGERIEHYETERVRKDGRQISVSLTFSPITDAVGNMLGASAIARDITAQQRAEIQFRSLISTTQDAVISIDRQGGIDLFNPAAERIFGYARSEVQGQKLQLLMPEPYASEHDEYVTRYERTGERRAIGRTRTVAARRKNGEVFPIELSVAEFGGGSDVRYGAFIRDISEKVHLQEQLIERERLAAIGTTVAKLVHEIGNPLNGMAVATQLLQRRLDRYGERLDDKVYESAQSLRTEVARLSQLLQEFRSLSRRQQFIFQPTNLAAVVQEIFVSELPHYTERGVRVEQNLPPDLPAVMADGNRLKQALLNLCKNALEAMPDGGTLAVRASNSRERVTVEVTDTGRGIPAGVNIFEPFVTTKPEGTGLGLPIVRQIVAAHGGVLTHASELGRGTTFLMTLPLHPRGGEGNGR